MEGTPTALAHGLLLLLLLLLLPLASANISRLENVSRRIRSGEFAETRTIEITDSRIQTIERNAFPHAANMTDATLHIVNTTIGDWYANDMSSFASVNITGSTIKRLHAGGINVFQPDDDHCTSLAAASHVRVHLTNSMVGTLASGAIRLQATGGQLKLNNINLSRVDDGALQLSFRVQLRVNGSVFGALSSHALRDVCSDLVTFRSNRMLDVGAHSLHFGSEPCAEACPRARLFVRRIRDNELPCNERLRWLRDAQAGCSPPPKSAADDYRLFVDSSLCGGEGVPPTVAQFLGPPRTGPRFTRSELVLAVAVPVAVLALLAGMLFGRQCGRRSARGRSFNEEPRALQVSTPLHRSTYRNERQRQEILVMEDREKPPLQQDRAEAVPAQPDRIPAENDYVPVMRPPPSVPPECDTPPPVRGRPPPKGHPGTTKEPLYANLHGVRALAGWKN